MKDSRQANRPQPSSTPQSRVRVSPTRIHRALARACGVCQSDQENPAWDYAVLFSAFHREAASVPTARILPHKTVRVHLGAKRIHTALAHGSSGSWQQPENAARRYALCCLPVHLLKAGLLADMFAAARNEVFLGEQERAFPEEPDLPLRTLRLAWEVAADVEDAVAVADFVLTFSRRIRFPRQESPLDQARQGNVKRALALASLQRPAERLLWYLLLFADRHTHGKPGESLWIWHELRRLHPLPLNGWQAIIAAYCLRYAPTHEPRVAVEELASGTCCAGTPMHGTFLRSRSDFNKCLL